VIDRTWEIRLKLFAYAGLYMRIPEYRTIRARTGFTAQDECSILREIDPGCKNYSISFKESAYLKHFI
jgi:hypothetical protein